MMNKTELKEKIKMVGGAIKKSTNPLFECVHMDANHIRGISTSYEVEIRLATGLPMPVAVNYDKFKQLVFNINEDVDVEIKDESLLVSTQKKLTAKLAIMEKGHTFERRCDEIKEEFEVTDLIDSLKEVKHALGDDMLGAYYIGAGKKNTDIVALDGYRISSRGQIGTPNLIIPAEVGDFLPQVFEEGEKLNITVYKNGAIRFVNDKTVVTSSGRDDIKLLDFARYLATDSDAKRALVPQEDLIRALKIASVYNNIVQLKFTGDMLTVMAHGPYGETAIPIKGLYGGHEVMLSVNSRFFEEAVRSIPYVDINVFILDESSPLVIKENKGRIKEIVLPVRT